MGRGEFRGGDSVDGSGDCGVVVMVSAIRGLLVEGGNRGGCFGGV